VPTHPPTNRSFRSAHLRADCAKCCGLCCIAPAFDANQGFGFDKPAQTPCANLRPDFRCVIHHQLHQQGFPACSAFDCHGAGQRVTQQLFAGKHWAAQPELAGQMFSAYYRYRILHELMALLEVALEHVPPHEAPQLRRLARHIDELCESGAAAVETFRVDPLRNEVLSRLRAAIPGRSPGLGTD
jgi:hypothetical protein